MGRFDGTVQIDRHGPVKLGGWGGDQRGGEVGGREEGGEEIPILSN